MTFELTKEGEILQFTHTYIVAYPKLLTLTSTLAPTNDPVTILGPDENLVNMMKSMSPCLPTIGFPLQSPCPPCQAAINVSMTRLRILLSHHARATHTPSSARDNTLQTAPPPHHTIYPTIAAFCLILLPPVSFCLVTPGTHPLIILLTARLLSLLPDTKFQKCVGHHQKLNKVDALINPASSISHLPFQRTNPRQVC